MDFGVSSIYRLEEFKQSVVSVTVLLHHQISDRSEWTQATNPLKKIGTIWSETSRDSTLFITVRVLQ